MSKFKFKQVFIPAFSLCLICFVVSLCLSATNFFTRNSIDAQELQKAESSRKIVLPEAETFQKYEDIDNCFIGYDSDGNIVGYTFVTQAKGYGGAIVVMTGISSDKVEGIEILSQNETPGLGTNAENTEFKDQYRQDIPKNGFKVVKGNRRKEGEIQAITGATISTKAVTEATNEAMKLYNSIVENGGMN